MKPPKTVDTYSIPSKRQKYKISILSLLIFLGFAFAFLGIVTWFHTRYNINFFRVTIVKRSDSAPVCTEIPDLERFDCHPDPGATEENCLQRGCCFRSAQNSVNEKYPRLGIPYCFYPSNYNGYSIENISQDGRHIRADLKRSSPSGFPKDILNLHLVISFIDDYTLRIKITDANAERFEVPIPINDTLKNLEKPCYDVKIDSKTRQIVIARKATGTIIFKTNLSQLVYSDQFLQLSSHLPSSYIYGIGEHYSSFLRNVNWARYTLFNSDRGPWPNYPLYGSHPFYLSLEEDGNANGVFLFNSNAMDIILQPLPAITFRPIGGVLDFFVMLGPTPANVVQQYTGIVGRTFMPPYWSLGFQLCRYGYNSLNTTKETLQRNIDADISVDVQWNDIDYMDQRKDFTYDQDKYAGLPEFVEELHSKGMHYVVMTDPGLSCSEKPGTYPPYDEGLEEDIFIKNPNGTVFKGKVWTGGETAFPDFSNPRATAYWSKQFSDFHNKVNFDGVWIDMNEPSNFYSGEKEGCMNSTFEDPPYLPNWELGSIPLRQRTVCMTAKHYSTIHYNEHNLYGYREAAATNQALKNIRQKRPFVISRASFSGLGQHSGHWSGDIWSTWKDMRYSISSMLNFNLFGISMVGSDICGFSGDTTIPLCARWQSLGAFYPFARNHNSLGAKNVTELTAYYPKGVWYTFEGKLINSSGENITAQVPLTDISYAFRGGYILPAQVPDINTERSRKHPFALIGGLDENLEAHGELYWDDGDSLDSFGTGNYTLIQFNVNKTSLTSTVVHKGYDEPMNFGIIQLAGLPVKPTKVVVNDVHCDLLQSPRSSEQQMNSFTTSKIFEMVKNISSNDLSCVFSYVGSNGISIGSVGFTLLSPLTVTWE
ncbi:unnamed protein product [Larinioides sclopetarius]|uniref:P-type domain-containing protein n=1 Tax=Larinioides sclopetarius TaxID=280406 RepID=A0AAV1ZT67_9ARAC